MSEKSFDFFTVLWYKFQLFLSFLFDNAGDQIRGFVCIYRESYNDLGWKRPSKSASPEQVINLSILLMIMEMGPNQRVPPSAEGAEVIYPKQTMPASALAQTLLYYAFIQCRYACGMWYFTLCWDAIISEGVQSYWLESLARTLGNVFLVKMMEKSRKTKSSVTPSLVWSVEKAWTELSLDLLYTMQWEKGWKSFR